MYFAAFYYCNCEFDRREDELCLYTVNDDDGVDVVNHDVALLPFVEILDIWSHFGIELRILTPDRVESIGKTSIFGLDSATNR